MIINRWSIFRANLDPVIGSEQGQTRPVLVISDDEVNILLNCVNVLPITSRKEGRLVYPNEVLLPEEVFNLPNESIILCHQIRTLDKRRLTYKYSSITDVQIQADVLDALYFQLGL